MVPLPTPPGPEMTTITRTPLPARAGRSARGDGVEQLLALVGAEALHAAGLADLALLEQAAGLDLPEAGQGLEHGEDLHLADRVVAGGLLEQLGKRHRAHLQALLELGARLAGSASLLECSSALLVGQLRRQRHAVKVAVSGEAGDEVGGGACGVVRRGDRPSDDED